MFKTESTYMYHPSNRRLIICIFLVVTCFEILVIFISLLCCIWRLGTSSEGAQLRARMQSACLVSDMESFKAANPGCTIDDFVRWYSPRDWVEDEDSTKENPKGTR